MLLKGLDGVDAVRVPSLEHGATEREVVEWRARNPITDVKPFEHDLKDVPIKNLLTSYSVFSRCRIKYDRKVGLCTNKFTFDTKSAATAPEVIAAFDKRLADNGIFPFKINAVDIALLSKESLETVSPSQLLASSKAALLNPTRQSWRD